MALVPSEPADFPDDETAAAVGPDVTVDYLEVRLKRLRRLFVAVAVGLTAFSGVTFCETQRQMDLVEARLQAQSRQLESLQAATKKISQDLDDLGKEVKDLRRRVDELKARHPKIWPPRFQNARPRPKPQMPAPVAPMS